METIVMLIFGIFISVIGIVNIKGNISTIHSYNRRKVTEEDAPKYGKAVGTGTLIIGAAVFSGGILTMMNLENISVLVLLSGLAAGIGCILYAQFKYNKGIF